MHNKGAIFEYRNERLQEVKLHASAQKLNDYEGKVDIWHSEMGKKIQDARLSLQVNDNSTLLSTRDICKIMRSSNLMNIYTIHAII